MKYIDGKFDEIVREEKKIGNKVVVVVDQTDDREPNSIKTIKINVAKKCKLNYTGYTVAKENEEYRDKVTERFDINPQEVFALNEEVIVFPTGHTVNKLAYNIVEGSLAQLETIMREDTSDKQYFIKAPYHYLDKENMEKIKGILDTSFGDLNLNIVEYKGEPISLIPGQVYIGYAVTGLRASSGKADVIGPWFSDSMMEGKPNMKMVKWLSDTVELNNITGDLNNYILTEIFNTKRMGELMGMIQEARDKGHALVITDWNKTNDEIGCFRRLIKKKLETEYNTNVIELK